MFFTYAKAGRSALEHIYFQLIDSAIVQLIGTSKPFSEIAYELGFKYPQYFSWLFKSKTGLTPKEFRAQ